jgi:hypothetical protein
MTVIKRSHGLDYLLCFIHKGAWAYEVIVSPSNIEKMITHYWHKLGDDEILYEQVPMVRNKAIRFPGKKY